MIYKSQRPKTLILVFLFLVSPLTFATNGLNLIGFGYESIMMGGADIAVARDPSALSTNPAGLVQIANKRFDLDLVSVDISETSHSDVFNNSQHASNGPFYGMGVGYAHNIKNSPLAWGFSISGQGGAGFEYNNIVTPFATIDNLSSEQFTAKATLGVAYKINTTLSIGASFSLLHSKLDQSIFPDTSFSGATSFIGQQVSDATANALGAKIGLRYQVNPRTVIGVAYTTSSSMDFSGDQYVANFSSIGLGKVTYSNLNINGQRQPQELGLGISFQVNKQLLLAAEVNWIDWSSALSTSNLLASNPDNPFAPATISVNITDNWRDQWVWSTGFVYEAVSGIVLRGGLNYGRNPIPDNRLNPLLAAIIEKHVTFGVGFNAQNDWQFNSGIQWDIKNEATSSNPLNPTGSTSIERPSAITLFLSVNHRW